jgi:hypothetical protein
MSGMTEGERGEDNGEAVRKTGGRNRGIELDTSRKSKGYSLPFLYIRKHVH